MTNDELVRLLLERVAEAEETVTEEEKDEVYSTVLATQAASVDPFYYAAQAIAELLLGSEE
tara:strand:- start:254 stop:436 length:183 start_codon:yes stop_codon:yes gene_type:complete